MKKREVPQDNTKTFQGFGTKAIYALDEEGTYTRVSTSGWDVEEAVLRDIVNDFANMAEQAKQKVLAGKTSPIEYFMRKNFMDLELCAKGVGLLKYRVKRHMKPSVFRKLSENMLLRYADFFNISIADLQNFQEHIKHEQL